MVTSKGATARDIVQRLGSVFAGCTLAWVRIDTRRRRVRYLTLSIICETTKLFFYNRMECERSNIRTR